MSLPSHSHEHLHPVTQTLVLTLLELSRLLHFLTRFLFRCTSTLSGARLCRIYCHGMKAYPLSLTPVTMTGAPNLSSPLACRANILE